MTWVSVVLFWLGVNVGILLGAIWGGRKKAHKPRRAGDVERTELDLGDDPLAIFDLDPMTLKLERRS